MLDEEGCLLLFLLFYLRPEIFKDDHRGKRKKLGSYVICDTSDELDTVKTW